MTWPTTSAHPYTASAPCNGEAHHLKKGKALVNSAFTSDRWRDRTPMRRGEVVRYRRAKFCLTTKREQLVAFRHDAARQHRKARARRMRSAKMSLTPYSCGSHGRFAIPCYVVACESGYDWGAVNPSSGAFSAYQMLPSTYAGVCATCDRARPDLHLAAGRVWSRSGGSEWVCA